jgi:cation transport ATPase
MKRVFKLEGLECANCAAKMEKAINDINGVNRATVNFISSKLVIEADDDRITEITEIAEEIIKDIEPDVLVKKA